jgi:hypothetical protein
MTNQEYKTKLLKNSLNYHSNGYKVIFTNDHKIPVVGSWAKYRDNQTVEDINKMFKDNESKIEGLAVLCTDGMEVIDIDQKYSLDGQLCVDYLSAIVEEIGEDAFYNNITLAITKSGGAHLIYKTDIPAGNQKLASRYTIESEDGKKRVLLETRGKGGYICVYPTKGYKFDILNKEKGFAPKVSNEWRNLFISIARTFEETTENHKTKNITPTPTHVQGQNLSTIDAFNANHSPYELLEAAGWKYSHTRGENEHLIRPGKSKGVSAGYSTKKNLVYIFTSSSEFECNRAYNAFQVYSVLNHNSNYSDAAKQLYRDGFGDRMKKTQDTYKDKLSVLTSTHQESKGKAVSSDVMLEMYKRRFSLKNAPAIRDYHLFVFDEFDTKLNVASFGDLVTITGAAKSRKSSLGSAMVSTALNDKIEQIIRFKLDAKGRNIVYIDTEQSEDDYYEVQKRMHRQANIEKDPLNYFSFDVAEFDMLDMLGFVEYAIIKTGNVGILYLDGIVDLCENYNDQVISRKLVAHLRTLATKYNTMIISILHNARSTGDARGHLGTELINKSRCVIQVTKNAEDGDDYSSIHFKYSRGKAPKDFDITHDPITGNIKLY